MSEYPHRKCNKRMLDNEIRKWVPRSSFGKWSEIVYNEQMTCLSATQQMLLCTFHHRKSGRLHLTSSNLSEPGLVQCLIFSLHEAVSFTPNTSDELFWWLREIMSTNLFADCNVLHICKDLGCWWSNPTLCTITLVPEDLLCYTFSTYISNI